MPTLFLIVFVDLVGFGLVIPLLPFYALRFAASPQQVTVLLAVYSLMQLFTAPLWGRLSVRVGRGPVPWVSMAASVLAYACIANATALWMLFAARALAGACAGNIAAAQAYIADVTKPEERARGMGLIGAAFGLGFIIGPALGGLLAGNDPATADVQTPAWVAAGLSFLALCGVALLLPESLPADQRLLGCGLARIACGLLVLPFAHHLAALVGAISALALGMGLMQPSLNSLISRRAGREEQGEVLGVSQSAGSLSRVLGPAAAGFFFGEFGRNAAFLWGAALVAAALVVAFKLTRTLGGA